ncbi:hypothetical protein [Mesorhizobium sp. J8]|uniref:hypothetical protein n=1 Tax=Mesorhizobium sp. J8 TaxID=2777475 RepID=UPI00191564A2|nr:hypothetical protein [Mesorhizobium sp. J8]BCM19273.1 hypothetical protein MJ8_30460 [Mesorhizobium sp. J8]
MSFLITFIVGRLGISRFLAGIIAWAAIVAIASGAALGAYQLIKHKGADELRARIEKENQHAIEKGVDARLSFDDCIDAGGVYDFRRQRCASPALGHR